MRLDNAIHRINLYLVDSSIIFPNTNPLDSDLSSGQRYPTFEQLGPGEHKQRKPMVFVSIFLIVPICKYSYDFHLPVNCFIYSLYCI